MIQDNNNQETLTTNNTELKHFDPNDKVNIDRLNSKFENSVEKDVDSFIKNMGAVDVTNFNLPNFNKPGEDNKVNTHEFIMKGFKDGAFACNSGGVIFISKERLYFLIEDKNGSACKGLKDLGFADLRDSVGVPWLGDPGAYFNDGTKDGIYLKIRESLDRRNMRGV